MKNRCEVKILSEADFDKKLVAIERNLHWITSYLAKLSPKERQRQWNAAQLDVLCGDEDTSTEQR